MSLPPERRVVVVLGFHRSGTSMITRMLNLLGVDLGEPSQMLPAEERDNAAGYWEPRWMIELNEELLELLGSGTFAQFSPDPGWEHDQRLDSLRDRARALVQEHFGDSTLWGWKDPRTSLTLPFWRTVVDVPASYVICVRSPADAVASALKRGVEGLHRWSYAERWLDYTAAALSNTADAPRALVFYEDALRDPANETRRLAEALQLDAPDPERLESVVASVEPELRHHTTDALDVAVDPGLPAEVRALYLLLRAHRELEPQVASDRGVARLATAIERIGVELRTVRTSAVAAEHARHAGERRAAEQLEAAERERSSLRAAIDALGAELRETTAAGEAELGRRDVALAERDARIAEQAAVIAEQAAVVAQQDAAIATYRDSRSWRLTKPLRTLGERLRQRRR